MRQFVSFATTTTRQHVRDSVIKKFQICYSEVVAAMLSCRFILYLAYFQKVSGQTVLVGKEVEAESKAQFEADSEPESEAESETKSESESMVR